MDDEVDRDEDCETTEAGVTTKTWLSTAMRCSLKLVDAVIVAFAVRTKVNEPRCSFARENNGCRYSTVTLSSVALLSNAVNGDCNKQVFRFLCQHRRGDILDSANTANEEEEMKCFSFLSLSLSLPVPSHDNLLSSLGSLNTPSTRIH